MAQPLIRPDLLGRPLTDVETVIDDALRIVNDPGGYPEGLYHQARGVLHAVQYLRGRTPGPDIDPPSDRADIEQQRWTIYQRLTDPAFAAAPWTVRLEAHSVWLMLGYVLGRRHESPLSQVAARAA